jgi:hypothetical protein
MEAIGNESKYLQQPPLEEWLSRDRHRSAATSKDLEIELCDICRRIHWHPILLGCCPDDIPKNWPYRWADIPTFQQMEM